MNFWQLFRIPPNIFVGTNEGSSASFPVLVLLFCCLKTPKCLLEKLYKTAGAAVPSRLLFLTSSGRDADAE